MSTATQEQLPPAKRAFILQWQFHSHINGKEKGVLVKRDDFHKVNRVTVTPKKGLHGWGVGKVHYVFDDAHEQEISDGDTFLAELLYRQVKKNHIDLDMIVESFAAHSDRARGIEIRDRVDALLARRC